MPQVTKLIKERAKAAITREYRIIKIEGSCKKLLPEKILSSARENFQCRTVAISEKLVEKEGQKTFDYFIGLHTKDASKNTYRRRSLKMFPGIDNFKVFDPSAKKGLGGWACALCSDGLELISCSGELNKTKLKEIALKSKKKKRVLTLPKKENAYNKKSPEQECKKPLLVSLPYPFPWFFQIIVSLLKEILKYFLSKLLTIAISRLIVLSISFLFFLYVYYYKDGASLTPEMLWQRTPQDVFDWLLDWQNPGLPPKFTVKMSFLDNIKYYTYKAVSFVSELCSFFFNVKNIYYCTKGFFSWISGFFR